MSTPWSVAIALHSLCLALTVAGQVETRQQEKFNRYLKAGTVLKNYASVLVMLLRLRQICSHPALIQENGSYFLAPDEVDDPEEYRDELSRARSVMSPEFVKTMREKFKDAALRRMEAEKEVRLRAYPEQSLLTPRSPRTLL